MAPIRSAAVTITVSLFLAAAAAAKERTLPPAPAGVQTSREYGIDFVTVNPSGRAVTPYTVPSSLNPFGDDPRYVNRPIGNVPYAFRMAGTEVTTGQYLDFVNLAWQMNPQNRFAIEPNFWGARLVESSPTSMRWELDPSIPNAADVPVSGIAWIQAAWFSNYLHNGRQNNLQALLHGAYDATTFAQNPDGTFTGQLTRSPGARFWIPASMSGRWRAFTIRTATARGRAVGGRTPTRRSRSPCTARRPSPATANAGWQTPTFDEFNVPVGSYDAQSPWGLFDVAGGVDELTEGVSPFAGQRYRWAVGSQAGESLTDAAFFDNLGAVYLALPDTVGYGLRIAAAVPAPSAIVVFVVFPIFRRRR